MIENIREKSYKQAYRGKGRRPLICPNCGNKNKKTFEHLDTESVLTSFIAGHRLTRRIYQCQECREIFTFDGHYDGGEKGELTIREDLNSLLDGFEMLDDEFMENDNWRENHGKRTK